MRVLFAATVLVSLLGACGIKGPLVLPPSMSVPVETADSPEQEAVRPEVDTLE